MNCRLSIYISYIFLTFSALLFLSGCKSSELRAIENSVSVLELETGREVDRWEREKGITLGKPVYAQLMIDYEPVDYHTKKDVFEEIVATLKENHWKEDELNIVPDYFTATLEQDNFEITASVLLHPDKNFVTVYMKAY